jgi:hypothetical protein
MNEPAITTDEARARVEKKTAPKVTKELIESRISGVRYLMDGKWTFCILTLANGFEVVGKSAPVSAENGDALVGQRYSYDDAVKQMWPLEAYLLAERVHDEIDF